MKSKMLGAILLVAGTSIGGGMLGLPIVTAKCGFLNASLLFFICWAFMTFTALLILEVNLCFPKNSNMISMAKATLGKPGEIFCWTVYLFFLYALVSAYISGGQDILHGLFSSAGISLPVSVCGVLFVLLFGSIVIAGTRHVDIFNRSIMLLKLSAILFLFLLIATHTSKKNYEPGHLLYILPAISVAATAFGFSNIIPSLRSYIDDAKKLRLAILIGSFLPLVCYLGWVAVIFGAVPLSGDYGLERLTHLDQPITGLLNSINHYVPAEKIAFILKAFTSICVLTAFACVSLALSDYLADGFKVTKEGKEKWLIAAATFIPPLLITLFYPKAFILFLSFAGILCAVLLALMPSMMAWSCRYVKGISTEYQVYGGKITLMIAMIVSVVVIVTAGYQMS